MKNRQIKQLFYKYCKMFVYVPSIFVDEYWDYFMNTVGEFVGTKKYWDEFCYILSKRYNNDVVKMDNEFKIISGEIASVILQKYNNITLPQTNDPLFKKHCKKFVEIEDGVYLSLDLRHAITQVMLYYNIISYSDLKNIFNKFENYEEIENCKWLYSYIFYIFEKKRQRGNLHKLLLWETINSGDPIFNNISDDYYICGDRLLIKINENEITHYKSLINKQYKTTNNVIVFVDICYKTSIEENKFPKIHIDNTLNSIKHFATNSFNGITSYDIYPQIYKKMKNEEITQKDLSYGYDDVISFFKKNIWED